MSKWIVDIHGDIEGDYEIVRKYEEPKTGKWLETDSADPYWYMCSECHRRLFEQEAFCPSCGAKMKREV